MVFVGWISKESVKQRMRDNLLIVLIDRVIKGISKNFRNSICIKVIDRETWATCQRIYFNRFRFGTR